MKKIQPVRAPNLPLPPDEYSRTYFDQLTNALRLYFTRRDNNEASLFGRSGGQLVSNPYVQVSSNLGQQTLDNIPVNVKWSSVDFANQFNLKSQTEIEFDVAGIWRVEYEMLCFNSDSSPHTLFTWLKLNGKDVGKSAREFYLDESSGWMAKGSCMIETKEKDVLSLSWTADKCGYPGGLDGVYITLNPKQSKPYARPEVPSVLTSITFVSAPQG